MIRHRLYDVDFVLNRTLVYGALSACIVGAYAGARVRRRRDRVGPGHGSSPPRPPPSARWPRRRCAAASSAASTACCTARATSRRRAVAELGHRLEATLEPDAVLPTLVDAVSRALRLPVRGRRARDADRLRAGSARREPRGDAARDPAARPGRDRRPPAAVAAPRRRGALARRPARARDCSRARQAPRCRPSGCTPICSARASS